MTVDEMLSRMSLSEFMRWAAYYSTRGSKKQTPEQIMANMNLSLAGVRKK